LRFRNESRYKLKIKRIKMAKKAKNNHVEKPSAWVVSSEKGRKSIKNGKVYLKDKEEFQIELFNPLTDCVLADIKLNGNTISQGGLVIRPGERFYLDCFVDDKKKFVFNTYEVEDSLSTKIAISKNGMLEVFFYKENVVSLNNWRNRFDRVIVEKYYPAHYPHYQPFWYTTPNVYCGTTITTGGLSGTTGGFNGTTTGVFGGVLNGSNIGNNITGSIGTTNTAYYSDTNSTPINSTLTTSYSSNSIETGRVERGNESEQNFDEVDMDFEKFHISSIVLQLLPESVKPVDTKELKKEKFSNPTEDIIGLIKKLADLNSAGILTDEEFSEKKAELLSRI
jgi:hypothetical protein